MTISDFLFLFTNQIWDQFWFIEKKKTPLDESSEEMNDATKPEMDDGYYEQINNQTNKLTIKQTKIEEMNKGTNRTKNTYVL